MDRRLLFPAVAITAWAQQSSPEAMAAEKALRERVQKFYQLQQDKKYREAEAMVADDTKDLYYNGKKADIQGFAIDKVQLLEGGAAAKVIIKVKVLLLMPGAGAQVFDMPSPSEWKMENGEWRWYVSDEAKSASPFGKLKTSGGGSASIDPKGAAPGGIGHTDLAALDSQITIDRSSIAFTPDEPVQTVTITNGLPGPLDIRVDTRATLIKGLIVKVDQTHVDAGKRAVITFRREGTGPLSDFVPIITEPLNKTFTITLTGK